MSSGFATEEDAKSAGESLGEALTIVGALERLGIDVGLSQPTLQFSEAVRDAVLKQAGKELLVSRVDAAFILRISGIEALCEQALLSTDRRRICELIIKSLPEPASDWKKNIHAQTFFKRDTTWRPLGTGRCNRVHRPF